MAFCFGFVGLASSSRSQSSHTAPSLRHHKPTTRQSFPVEVPLAICNPPRIAVTAARIGRSFLFPLPVVRPRPTLTLSLHTSSISFPTMPRRKVALRTSATTTALIEDASEPSEAAQSMSTITGPPPTDRRSVSPRFETLATPVPELRGRPKRSASGRKKTSYVEAEEDDEDGQTPSAFADDAFDDETVVAPSPVKHRKASPKKTKKVKKADPEDAEYVAPAEDDLATVADPEASDGAAESDLTPVEDLEGDEKPKKKRKKTASPRKLKEPKPEPIYDIPDVQTLPTTFRGRLGYGASSPSAGALDLTSDRSCWTACLNTVLRNKRPARLAVFCSRTCRLDTIAQKGLDHVKALGLQNSADLAELIQWNEDNGIRFLRVSSEMFPFASHKEHGYDLAFADDALKHAGELANKYGHRCVLALALVIGLGKTNSIACAA